MKVLVVVKIIDIEESDIFNLKLVDIYSEFMKEISVFKIFSDSGVRNINFIFDVLLVG